MRDTLVYTVHHLSVLLPSFCTEHALAYEHLVRSFENYAFEFSCITDSEELCLSETYVF